MKTFAIVALFLLVFVWYLTFLATRLDRLHHRVEISWVNLDSLLQRRAAIALEIARSEIADPASAMLLTAAAYQAREASIENRSAAESGLSGALGVLLADGQSNERPAEIVLLRELSELTDKVRIGITLHVDAVARTHLVRSKAIVRVFRLAGTAPLPITYEFETDVL